MENSPWKTINGWEVCIGTVNPSPDQGQIEVVVKLNFGSYGQEIKDVVKAPILVPF